MSDRERCCDEADAELAEAKNEIYDLKRKLLVKLINSYKNMVPTLPV